MNVCVADQVYARCSDGIAYIGTVTEVDPIRNEVQVKFEEGDEFWTRLSDLRLATKKQSSAERCRACFIERGKIDGSGDLIVCKQCNEAFHVNCHRPPVSPTHRDHWFCRFCVLSKAVTRPIPSTLSNAVRQTYPYDLEALQWDDAGKQNKDERYCYCGGPGDWNLKMLQCGSCSQWFHEACIVSIRHPILNGDLFYQFTCSVCANGDEVLKRLNISWPEALHLIIYNLGLISPARFFRLETDIIKYAKNIWTQLQVSDLESEAPDWDAKREKIIDVLQSDKRRFHQFEKNGQRLKLWGLIEPEQPPKPLNKKKLTPVAPRTKLTSMSLSDEIGNIKLKITRSPSEAKPRYQPESDDEDDVFFTETPSPVDNQRIRKSDSLKNIRSSNGSSNSTPSYKTKRKPTIEKRGRPRSANSKKRRNSFDSSISSEPKTLDVSPVPSKSLKASSRQPSTAPIQQSPKPFCLSSCIPQRNFFSTEWRMTSGEGFRVLGKRTTPDGKISYLIEWEGCHDIL